MNDAQCCGQRDRDAQARGPVCLPLHDFINDGQQIGRSIRIRSERVQLVSLSLHSEEAQKVHQTGRGNKCSYHRRRESLKRLFGQPDRTGCSGRFS